MSWQQAELTGEVTGLGVLRVLEAIRVCSGISASRTPGGGRSASTRLHPRRCSARCGNPRRPSGPVPSAQPIWGSEDVRALPDPELPRVLWHVRVSGILFNHESPRRGAEFVSRKVSLGVARIKLGHERQLRLGTLWARRDWGFAATTCGPCIRCLRRTSRRLRGGHRPDAYRGGSCRPGVRGRRARLAGSRGLRRRLRPAREVDHLCADPSKAAERLGWEPKVGFDELISMMVEADLELLSRRAVTRTTRSARRPGRRQPVCPPAAASRSVRRPS